MPIGRLETEDDLRAFIQQTLRGSDQARLIRQLQGSLGGLRLLGPYSAASGSLATGAASGPFTTTHNLGHTNYWLVPTQDDGSFGYSLQWTLHRNANTVDVYFQNVGASNPASMTLRYWLLVAS